jgi:hypothetical protein
MDKPQDNGVIVVEEIGKLFSNQQARFVVAHSDISE